MIDHILEHGYITTEELKDIYGYNHPPRAARDVRERGIPLETFYVESSDGRRIGAYRFGDPADVEDDKLRGRKVFSKDFKAALLARQDSRCAICNTRYQSRYLQVDHRVPYEVSGDVVGQRNLEDYMLLCSTCNRAKSWSCEHCDNWLQHKDETICRDCYWAYPHAYAHVAMQPERRIALTWQGDDVESFDDLRERANDENFDIRIYIKSILKSYLDDNADEEGEP